MASTDRPTTPEDQPFDTATNDTPYSAAPPPPSNLLPPPTSPLHPPPPPLPALLRRRSRAHRLPHPLNQPRPARPPQRPNILFLASYSLFIVLITGRLGDHLGHKYVFVFGWVWMSVWSLISGLWCSMSRELWLEWVMVCWCRTRSRCWQGRSRRFRGGGMLRLRFWGFCAPAGYIFGGVVGAAFAEKDTWRWGFWFWAIGSLIIGIASFFVVPHSVGSPVAGLSFKQFDYIGTVLGVLGLVLFGFAWNQASVVGWHEPYTYALLIVGIVLIVAFAFSQSQVAAPVLPNSLWTRRGFAPIVIAMSFGWISFGIFLYYTTIFILTVRKEFPLSAVAEMVPLVIGGLFATASVGIFISKVPAQYIFGISMFSFFIGKFLMSFANCSSNYWAFIFPACLLVVGGPDLSFASSSILISNTVLPEEQGVAGSFISTMVQYSIAIGLGIAATVEVHTNKGGSDMILGYRCAHWLSMGFAAFAFFVVILFVRDHRFDETKDAEKEIRSNDGTIEEALTARRHA